MFAFLKPVGLVLKKYSPQILMGIGTAATVAGVGLTIRSTIKAGPALAKYKQEIQDVEDAIELDQKAEDFEFSEADAKNDRRLALIELSKSLAKQYALPLGVLIVGVSCFFGAFGIMSARSLALTTALQSTIDAFTKYRENVRKVYGDDVDDKFATREVISATDDGDGTVSVECRDYDKDELSLFTKWFDESSRNWRRDSGQNLLFLKAQQDLANDMLYSRGYLFLNEVYELLDLPLVREGQIIGWWLDQHLEAMGAEQEDGDGFVDFGLTRDSANARDFLNGHSKSIILHFNPDGPIHHKFKSGIPKKQRAAI